MDLALHRSVGAVKRWLFDGDQPSHRLAGFSDNDLLAGSGLFDEAGKMSLGCVNVDGGARQSAGFHDPADRIIVATARRWNARLLTRDEKLIEYGRWQHLALV